MSAISPGSRNSCPSCEGFVRASYGARPRGERARAKEKFVGARTRSRRIRGICGFRVRVSPALCRTRGLVEREREEGNRKRAYTIGFELRGIGDTEKGGGRARARPKSARTRREEAFRESGFWGTP